MKLLHIGRTIYAGVFLLLLMFLWPNFIHEPLHVIIASTMGVNTQIKFDVGIPATPVVAWSGTFPSTGSYIFFLVGPTIFAIVILLGLLFTRPFIETHVSLPIYLAMEIITNIRKYTLPTSDFRFLEMTQSPGIGILIIAIIIIILAAAIIAKAIRMDAEVVANGIQKSMPVV